MKIPLKKKKKKTAKENRNDSVTKAAKEDLQQAVHKWVKPVWKSITFYAYI